MLNVNKAPLEQTNLLDGKLDDTVASELKSLQQTYEALRKKLS